MNEYEVWKITNQMGHMNFPVLYKDEFPEWETMSWWEHDNIAGAYLWV